MEIQHDSLESYQARAKEHAAVRYVLSGSE